MKKIVILFFLVLTLICACSKSSENAEDLINEANLLWDGKQYTDPQKAIEYLNKAIKLQPDYAETYNQRGVAYKNMGNNKQAIEDFNTAIRLQPDLVLAHYNRATIYNNLGQYKEAIADCSEAIRLKPDFSEAYNIRGINQNKMKNLFNKMGLEDKYIFIDMTKVYFFDYNDGYYVKKFLNFDAYTSLHAEMIKK